MQEIIFQISRQIVANSANFKVNVNANTTSTTLPTLLLPTLLLLGPTAAGKTAVSLRLAAEFPLEIISVDSAMIYRGMDIGTGKPSPQEQTSTPHHLIDIRDISESYSCAEFQENAATLISEIHARDRIPLLVGGTLLYFKTLLSGLSPVPKTNPNVRAKINQDAETFGWAALHKRLAEIDPESALRIHPNDPQRLGRALEVYEMTGKPLSSFFKEQSEQFEQPEQSEKSRQSNQSEQSNRHAPNLPQNLIIFALIPEDRKQLHKHIEDRFHQMLDLGFVAEVEALLGAIFEATSGATFGATFRASFEALIKTRYAQSNPDPYNPDPNDFIFTQFPALRSVGYRQISEYLLGKFSYAEMVERGIAATRQLAKRQFTFLRSLSEHYPIEILKQASKQPTKT